MASSISTFHKCKKIKNIKTKILLILINILFCVDTNLQAATTSFVSSTTNNSSTGNVIPTQTLRASTPKPRTSSPDKGTNTPPTDANNSKNFNPRPYSIGALIYDGDSAAYGDPEAIASILDAHGISYKRASSDDINSMSIDELSQYGMIIWPGGYAGQMSSSLTPQARENIRTAVNQNGVGYVGICAGAFIAVSPPPTGNEEGPKWGLSILPAADLLPYYYLEDDGTDDAMVQINFAVGNSRSLVWWGGPYLPEYPKGVIARYAKTNQPAIVQTWAGKGMVILSGPHPEAPQNWRDKLGLQDSDNLDQDIAWQLFQATLNQQFLPALN